MTDLSMPAPERGTVPARRLVAAGFIRRLSGRTLAVRVTEAGVTGRITPATSGGPVCCGQLMRRDGSQYVCDRCGSWTDPGTTTHARVAELHRLAHADYEQAADARASWAAQDHSDHADVLALAAEAVNGR
ncbi:hypothetical protein [Streptomyces sp. YIM S03343]